MSLSFNYFIKIFFFFYFIPNFIITKMFNQLIKNLNYPKSKRFSIKSMQHQKKQKRRGTIPLQQCKGPSKQLYHAGLRYLTVGDGDFSFSLSIVRWLDYAYSQKQNQKTYLTVTSYDSRQQLEQMYKHTIGNTIAQLQKRKNVSIFYQIDVNKFEMYREKLLAPLKGNNLQKIKEDSQQNEGYDRIIWNFPHAGFPQVQKGDHKGPGFEWQQGFHQKHIDIIGNFFKKGLLYLNKNGLAIVTHKTIPPFGLWNIPKIGTENGYILQKTLDFDIDQYPGYQNRRGAGKCGGKKFPCEDAKTYVFRIDSIQKKQQIFNQEKLSQ